MLPKRKLRKKEIEEKIALFKLILQLEADRRIALLKHLNEAAVNHISDCVFQALNDNLLISEAGKKKLRKIIVPRKERYFYLSKYRNNLGKRQRVLIQEGKGVGAIIGFALPFLSSLLTSIVNDKKRK